MLLNCCAGEDSCESLGQQDIKEVSPKENQAWMFIEMTDVEAEAPIFWLPDTKSQLQEDSEAEKD